MFDVDLSIPVAREAQVQPNFVALTVHRSLVQDTQPFKKLSRDMKKKSFLTTVAVVVLGIVLLAAIAFFVLPKEEISVNSSGKHEFTVDVTMERARKILVRTNAAKKIVAMADAELLDQEWSDLDIDAKRPLLKRDWHVDGTGEMKVRINNSYLGSHDVTLDQSLDIRAEKLQVSNKLNKPAGPIGEYSSELTLIPDDSGKARFETSLDLQINTTANFFTKSTVESEIQSAAQSALEKQEEAIRSVIADQDGKLLIVPKMGEDSKE